jgi:hypothetical protein
MLLAAQLASTSPSSAYLWRNDTNRIEWHANLVFINGKRTTVVSVCRSQ